MRSYQELVALAGIQNPIQVKKKKTFYRNVNCKYCYINKREQNIYKAVTLNL